jgi:hypothetical protein
MDAAACKSVLPTPVEEEGVMCITEGFSCFPVLLRELLQQLFDPDHPTDIVPGQDNTTLSHPQDVPSDKPHYN